MKKPQYIATILALAIVTLISLSLCVFLILDRQEAENASAATSYSAQDYTIIYGKDYTVGAAELLEKELAALTGSSFDIQDDSNIQSGKEIRVGPTARTDSTYIDIASEIGTNGFKIVFDEDGSIDLISLNETAAKKAVLCLIDEYLVKSSDGRFVFKCDLGYTSVEKGGDEPDSALLKTKAELRFGEDGKFKILLVSDVHAGSDTNTTTGDAIEAMVEKESPDLVLFAGNIQDRITDKGALRELLTKISTPMESRKIPWAHVFGPDDIASGLSLDLQMDVYSEFPYCVSKKGALSVDGVSNYFLPVRASASEDIKFGIWGFDSSVADPSKTYGYITPSQVSWFLSEYAHLTKQTASAVPGIMFMCTPIPEFDELLKVGSITGNAGEDVSFASPNSGLFSAALSTGSILGIYCGYDHLNDFSGELLGIELGYLSSIGYDGYGLGGTFDTNNSLRGARLVEIDENDINNFTSKMIYAADYGISREAK